MRYYSFIFIFINLIEQSLNNLRIALKEYIFEEIYY